MKVKSKLTMMVATAFMMSFMMVTAYAQEIELNEENQCFEAISDDLSGEFSSDQSYDDDSNTEDESYLEPDNDEVAGKFKYKLNDYGKVVITGYADQPTGELVIPDTLVGIEVTEIGANAFKNCSAFTGTLVIPDSVTKIGSYAFKDCSGFRALKLGSSVGVIDTYAFQNCTGFAGDLIIPDSVTRINQGAFNKCRGFSDLQWGENLTKIGGFYDYGSAGPGAFEGCDGLQGDLIIPDSVNEIGDRAFKDCNGFKGKLVTGDGVSAIGERAFNDCYGFKSLSIGKKVSKIDNSAFNGCKGMVGDLVIPDSVTSLGNGVFRECTGFTGNLKIGSNLAEIPGDAFSNCKGLSGILVIPDSVSKIGGNAFKGCNGFTGLETGDTVSVIDNYAFNGCNGLKSIKFGSGVSSIGSNAFAECSSLEGTLTIPENVTKIESNSFYKDYNVSVVVNNSNAVITADDFLKNDNEYFVTASGQKIDRKGKLEKDTYTKQVIVPVTGVTLNATSAEVFAGHTFTLNATVAPDNATDKSLTWTSANAAVAGVDAGGVVSGVSPGTTTITVKTVDGGKTASCKVTVNDPSPAATTISSVANIEKGLKVKWKKSANADGYYVYRSANDAAPKQIATVTGLSYDDSVIKNGTKYSYTVYAYRYIEGIEHKSGASPAKICYRLGQCKIKSVKNNAKKTLTVTWGKNKKGSGYQIQYSTSKSFKSPKTITVKKASTSSKKITGLKKGKKYYVRIRPYKSADNKKYYGIWTTYGKAVKVKK